jgi:hypothetical protein
MGADGLPVLTPWSCAVYAERDGVIVAGGLVTDEALSRQGAALGLSTVGFSAYLEGIPYEGERSWVDVDPADLVRHAWDHAQGFTGGDLGVVVDDTTTPVRVGEEERDVAFTTGEGEDVSFSAGPVRWNHWSTHDLGSEVDKLASDTPLDYVEHHAWAGETVSHRLRLGYPRLGRRRTDLRFVVGENVTVEPTVGTGPWASEVVVLGAGEGRTMRRGVAAGKLAGRLRRPAVVVDKALQSHRDCEAAAAAELAWRTGADDVSRVTVMDHPSAPIGSWTPGDEVFIQGSGQGWAGGLHQWVRVLSDETTPATDTAVLTVAAAGRA